MEAGLDMMYTQNTCTLKQLRKILGYSKLVLTLLWLHYTERTIPGLQHYVTHKVRFVDFKYVV